MIQIQADMSLSIHKLYVNLVSLKSKVPDTCDI